METERVPHFQWNPNKKWAPIPDLLPAILLPNQTAITKTEIHTRKTESEYQGNALETSMFNQPALKLLCNLNELPKTESNQVIYDNLYKRQKSGT